MRRHKRSDDDRDDATGLTAFRYEPPDLRHQAGQRSAAMLDWIGKMAATAAALTLAVGGVGCDDDSSSAAAQATMLLFAGGAGQYENVTIQVDLNDVQIDFDSCRLAAALDDAGCDFELDLFDDLVASGVGGTLPPGFDPDLEITIGPLDDECVFAATEALTRCDVLAGDPSDLVAVTTNASCATGEFCDEDTPFLACGGDRAEFDENDCMQSDTTTSSTSSTSTSSTSSTSTSTTSSSTTSSSTTSVTSTSSTTTSTTSTSSTTSTTTGTAGQQWLIQINMVTPNPPDRLGSLGFEIDYSGAPGGFVGSGADIVTGGTLECTLSGGDIKSMNDDEPQLKLIAAYISLGGFNAPLGAPLQIALCNFEQVGPATPIADDFVITITDSSAPTPPFATVPSDSVIGSIVMKN